MTHIKIVKTSFFFHKNVILLVLEFVYEKNKIKSMYFTNEN